MADLVDLHLHGEAWSWAGGCRALSVSASVSVTQAAVSREVAFPGLMQREAVYRQ